MRTLWTVAVGLALTVGRWLAAAQAKADIKNAQGQSIVGDIIETPRGVLMV
jgi:hypothetical protein